MSNVLPKGWNVNQIGNILDISTGDKDTQNRIEDGKYPFFVRSNTIERLDSYSFDGEAVLTAGDGVGVGKVFHYYNGKFAFHQRVYAIYGFNKEIDGKYFYRYFSDNFLKEVEKYSAKTSVDSVRLKMISNMDILLPPIKEQQKIAEVISEVDNAILKTEKLFEKNKRLKTALMQDLLSYGIDENGKVRSCETHKFKPSKLGDIPEEWDCLELAKVCDIKDGTHQTPKYVSDGIPFYSVENITNDEFKNVKFISYEEHKELTKNYKIELGDVLMTRIGSIGDCKYINWNVNASFYVSLALLKFYNKEYAKYFVQYSKSAKFKNEIDLHSLPNAVPKKINLGNISNVKILIPKSEIEQQKIAQILSSQDEKIEDIKNKLNKLKSLKASLMQDLLSGKVRVTKLMEENS